MLPGEIIEDLRNHLDEDLARLFELLRIPSIANRAAARGSEGDDCARAARWLADYARSLGLSAEVIPTAGRPVVLAEARGPEGAPTMLVYCHYDVQPPEPLEEWDAPPFEPAVRGGNIHARGASDDKGPLMAYLAAAGAWRRYLAGGGAGGREGAAALPVTLKFLVEGEEEIGSPNIEAFLRSRRERLSADVAVVADTSFFSAGVPSITYGLRGLAYVEVSVRGAATDVHSGMHGGAVANPINGLARMIAGMHDANGRVTLEGFYDGVVCVTDAEREAWAALPFDEPAYAASLGVEQLGGGEAGRGVLERLWARPTLDCNGIVGGYTAPGSKTIIPAAASAKISMRLVPRQDPERIVSALRRFVASHTPAGLASSVQVNALARPVLVPPDSPAIEP
jgi:acetylornithine deacetylase/succinyl-diaminopimelate desuccinylase-like protein